LIVVAFVLSRPSDPAKEARQALDNGDLDQASQLVDAALIELPNAPELLAIKGRVLAEREDWLAAAAVFHLAKSSMDLPEDQRVWATALVRLERWDGALEILTRLTEMTSSDPSVWNDLTVCRLRLGDLDGALESARRLARLSGGELRGHLQLAHTREERDELLQAAEEYQRVLEGLEDGSSEEAQFISRDRVLLSLGELLIRDGRSVLATKILRQYVETANRARGGIRNGASDVDANGARYLYGQALFNQAKDAEAEIQWQEVIANQPKHRKARIGLAEICLNNGRPQEAVAWLAPFSAKKDLPAEVAFLMSRAYSALEDEERVEEWERRHAYLRRWEHVRRKIETSHSQRQAYWDQVLYCHRLAFEQEWEEASQVAQRLARTFPAEFVLKILDAIDQRSVLPALIDMANEI